MFIIQGSRYSERRLPFSNIWVSVIRHSRLSCEFSQSDFFDFFKLQDGTVAVPYL